VQNDPDFSRSGWVSVQEGVVFLAVALSAALYVTDPSAARILQAMVLPIIDFFLFCVQPTSGLSARLVAKLSGRSDKLGSSL
jgi:hypothetical protein